MPDVDYDQRKNLENIKKHGIGFEIAAEIFEGDIVERPDGRFDYGEDKLVTLGMVGDRVLVVVYTWRHNRRRIISARKANKDEQEIYHKALANDRPNE